MTKSKIVAFVAALALFGASSASAAFMFNMNLGFGMRNNDVKELQLRLNQEVGTNLPGTTYFGSLTRAAVIQYQTAKGISPKSGYVGPLTRAALNGSTPSTPSGNLPAGCTSTVGWSPITGVKCDSTTSGPQTGPVTVSLAATNPAPSTFVAGQATANLGEFTFSGNGTVTNVTLQRIGVSSDTTPSNIYLFDGATRLTDAASVTNGGMITFTNGAGLFMVNGTKTISVRSDIASGTSGQTVGVKLVSFATAAGTTTANVSGNIHSIATATLAAVSAGTVTPSNSTINPGPSQTLWQSTLNVTQRDVWMKRLALRQIGSAPASALQNFKLFVNGVQVGSTVASVDAMGYVTFDLSANPILLAAGSRVVRVEADVIGGASRTIHLSLRQAADIDLVDRDYGVNITPTSTPWTASGGSNNGDLTIAGSTGGSLVVQKDTSLSSGDVTDAASDVSIGKFTAQAFGESIKIETIKAAFYSSDAAIDSLRNGRVLINGVQYGSTATLVTCDTDSDADCDGSDTSGTGTSFTVNYVIPAGQTATIEIRSDIYDNDGANNISANDTIVGAIAVGSNNAVRQDSLGYLSVPSTIVLGQTMTVKTASATLLKDTSYANQTVNLPQTGYKLADLNISAGTAEDLNVNTVSVDFTAVSGSTFTAADLTNVYVKVGNSTSTIYSTVSATGNTFSLPTVTVPKGTSVPVEVYANLLSGGVTSTDSIKTTVTVSGTSAVSGTSVSTSAVDGQTIAYGTGTFTISKDGSSPLARIAAGNQEVVAGIFKFQASNDTFTVKEVDVSVPSATAASAVSMVSLYDGATLVASLPFTGNDANSGSGTNNMASFTGLNWMVPSNTSKNLTVKFTLNNIGTGAGTSQQDVKAQLDRVRYQDSAGSVTNHTTDYDANELYVYKTIPTVSIVDLPNTSTLVNGSAQDLYKFTVTAPSQGSVALKQFILTTTWSDGGTADTLEVESLKLYEDGVDVTSNVVIQDEDGNSVEGTSGMLEADDSVTVSWSTGLESVIAAGTSKTYTLRGVPQGFRLTGADPQGDSVSFYLPGDTAHNGSKVYVNGTATATTIWGLHTSAAATGSGTLYNFIWSDNSSSTHSASENASSSGDWANGYKVLNLDLAGETWTK